MGEAGSDQWIYWLLTRVVKGVPFHWIKGTKRISLA